MGFFWQGLPPYLIQWSKVLLGGEVSAIETGTFEGDTTLLLANSFGNCTSIERSASLAERARRRFHNDRRINIIEGSSRLKLEDVVPPPDRGAFFWLDAHGVYDHVGIDQEENPLLEELRVIFSLRRDAPTVIAVDDARGMGIQPDWPGVDAITSILLANGYASAIVDDVLVAAPRVVQPDFYDLYKRSRIVEVGALFHVWNRVVKVVQRRRLSDAAIAKFRK